MFWLLTRLVVWPVKAGTGSAKLGYKTGRVLGYRRIVVFGLGVAVGLLVAPMTGAALREKLRSLLEGDMTNDPVPAEAPWGAGAAGRGAGADGVVDLTTEASR